MSLYEGIEVERVIVPVYECDRGGSGGGEIEIGESSSSGPLSGGNG